MSVIAGTIFQGTHKPLTMWFRAIWWMTGQKNGASALGMKRVLGLGSYMTAWAWLHKLHRAMVSPDREKLSGEVEVDEAYVGGKKPGKRGHGAAGKASVVIAVEDKGVGFGRIRLCHITDASAKNLNKFTQDSIEKGSTVSTDAWPGYNDLSSLGYKHIITNQQSIIGVNSLPLVHRVASLLKRWLLGTHQGAVSHEHLDYYLDEFTFRFNRRTSKYRGKFFTDYFKMLSKWNQYHLMKYHEKSEAENLVTTICRGHLSKVNTPDTGIGSGMGKNKLCRPEYGY